MNSAVGGGRRRLLLMTAATASGVVAVLLVFALAGQTSPPAGTTRTSVGFDFVGKPIPEDRPAPGFSAPALQPSGTIGLQEFLDQVVVLNFWASWCTACRQEAPTLESLWKRYGARGVQFLGIDLNDGRDAALAFQREFGITYPSVSDAAGRIAEEFGVMGLPTTFVLDQQGRIRYEVIGRIDERSLSRALDSLVGGAR
jgi:cytochrome c biogenesis protein CcmG, thiol:disulfide interchange protein DsbE